MNFEFARNAFALTGVVVSLYAVYRVARYFLQARGDDAPIRVKGGSIEVLNRLGDWELDDDEGAEYHTKGQTKGWVVRVWSSEAAYLLNRDTPEKVYQGKRAAVHFSVGGVEYHVVLRPNGTYRVADKGGVLTLDRKTLSNVDAKLLKLTVSTKSATTTHSFDAGQGYIAFAPK